MKLPAKNMTHLEYLKWCLSQKKPVKALDSMFYIGDHVKLTFDSSLTHRFGRRDFNSGIGIEGLLTTSVVEGKAYHYGVLLDKEGKEIFTPDEHGRPNMNRTWLLLAAGPNSILSDHPASANNVLELVKSAKNCKIKHRAVKSLDWGKTRHFVWLDESDFIPHISFKTRF